MARQTALPPTLPPRLIPRAAAAAYVSLSPAKFDELVDAGIMPPAKRLCSNRLAWDVRRLDAAVDALLDNGAAADDASWGDVDET